MDPFVAGWDLVGVIVVCIACGAAGGIAFDLTEPVLRRKRTNPAAESVPPADAEPSFGDNRVALPRSITVRGRRFWEAGFIGPVIVGSSAALAAVMLLAVNRPDAPSTIERGAVAKTLEAEGVDKTTIGAVDEALTARRPYVQWEELIPIGLIAGFAGVAVLRTARSRLLAAIGAVASEARAAGIWEGAQVSTAAVTDKAQDSSVDEVAPEAAPVLSSAITGAVEDHIEQLSKSSPFGNPDW